MEAIERQLFEAVQASVELAVGKAFPELWHERSHGTGDGPDPRGARIQAIVERGIENAVQVDISDAADLAAFIALGVALSLTPPGASVDWIRVWISRPETPGQAKIRMIESRLRQLANKNPAFGQIAKRVAMAREMVTP
jgi:hypothetical protein